MIAYKYKIVSDIPIVKLSSVRDSYGDVYFHVEYKDIDNKDTYCRFEKFSSALDFIRSNFK